MSHSHDNTMLARLGFADPDKRSGLHDELCAYLATEEASTEAVRAVGRKLGSWQPKRCGWQHWGRGRDSTAKRLLEDSDLRCSIVRSREYPNTPDEHCEHRFWCTNQLEVESFTGPKIVLEAPITKGSGQYSTTVGFIDVGYSHINLTGTCPKHGKYGAGLTTKDAFVDLGSRKFDSSIIFEVKAGFVSPNEVLRQIKFYKEYAPADAWAVFTGFRYSADDAALLEREGILVFSAGPKFAAWQKAKREATAIGGEEL